MPGAEHRGHRSRLRERLLKGGGQALADYEIVEMLLFAAKPRGDTKPLAKRLVKHFGGLGPLFMARPDQIEAIPEAGAAAAAAIKVVQAAMERTTQEQIIRKPALTSWDRVLDYCRVYLAHETVENFHLLFLDRKNVILAEERQQRGTVDHTPVYPREVVKRALEVGASALIMVHNHPSGDPTPSRADIEMTRKIAEIGAHLGITLHDHVVIGARGHYSFRSQGLL